MSSILKRIRQNSLSKHTRLLEDLGESDDILDKRITFHAKYLGFCLVFASSGEEVTSNAIREIIALARKQDKKLSRVNLMVGLNAIKVVDTKNENLEPLFQYSIYRISYCFADATYDHVFAFIASNENSTMHCHAFLCPKKKMAQAATLTIAQAFNMAYQNWQTEQEQKKEQGADPPPASPSAELPHAITPVAEGSANQETEPTSLIDLQTPKKDRKHLLSWDATFDEEEEDKERDLSFKTMWEANSPIPILQKLPPSANNLEFGAMAGSPHSFDSRYGSPMHGVNLSASVLMSPVGSPPSWQP